MPTFLMCPPDYFGIEYEINAWMDRRRPAVSVSATRQWRSLHDLLADDLGAQLELLEPVKGLPDLPFTANAGLVRDRIYIRSNFRHPERQRESPAFEAWFRSRGYQVRTLPEGACFEGEGDALFVGKSLFAGYRMRSDIETHLEIGRILNCEVLSLELIDPRFYHLDTCFFPLDARTVLYLPEAFDHYGQRVIEASVEEPIRVSLEDALQFGCNAIVSGRDAVLQSGCEGINRELRHRGFKVHEVDLSEFHKAGGSAKCLVLRLS